MLNWWVGGGAARCLDDIIATRPDLAVIDLMLVGGSGLTILRGLQSQTQAPVSMVLTNYAIPEFRHEAMQAGAHYFFDKTNEFGQVLDTVQALADRHAHTPRCVGGHSGLACPEPQPSLAGSLS